MYYFPFGYGDLDIVDAYGIKLDKRIKNTWDSNADDVSLQQIRSVMESNCIAPFYLNKILRPFLLKSSTPFQIHVHAKEGTFTTHKTMNHPHTNMAKAALAMLTRIEASKGIGKGLCSQKLQKPFLDVPWSDRFKSPIEETYDSSSSNNQNHITFCGCDPGFGSKGEYTANALQKYHIVAPPLDTIDCASRVLFLVMKDIRLSFGGTWKHYIPQPYY
jgi:hypothetical protein